MELGVTLFRSLLSFADMKSVKLPNHVVYFTVMGWQPSSAKHKYGIGTRLHVLAVVVFACGFSSAC